MVDYATIIKIGHWTLTYNKIANSLDGLKDSYKIVYTYKEEKYRKVD